MPGAAQRAALAQLRLATLAEHAPQRRARPLPPQPSLPPTLCDSIVQPRTHPNPRRRCIEYLKLTTDRGRTLAIGDANSATPTTSAAANSPGAYLTTFRGWTDSAGALQQLQIVWGTRCAPAGAAASPSPAAAFAESGPKPSPAAAAASPKPAVASPKPSPVAAAAASSKPAAASPKLSPATAVSSPKPSAARPKPAAAASPALAASSPAAAAAAAASPSPAGVPAAAAACAPRPDMCSETEAGLLNMCKAVSPFTSPKCVGGCCVSSGRCRFGSCLANGLGLDVPMACFGYNNIPKPFGLAPGKCAYLACKLAVPGCKTPLLGGSCVGAVALAPGSDASKLSANSAQYIGRPCVETTPTGGLVTLPSLGISNSEYVLAGWKACDCADVQILPKLNLTGLLPHITLPANPLTDVVAKISNETSKLMHRGAASASPSPSPSSGSGSAEAEGGDASLGAASGLGALKDLVMGAKSSAADPFSDFLSDDAAASPAPTADDASAAA